MKTKTKTAKPYVAPWLGPARAAAAREWEQWLAANKKVWIAANTKRSPK